MITIDEHDAQWIAEQLAGEALEADIKTSRYVINDATVLDTTTGLTWQREVPAERYTWQAAKDYAAALDLAGGGWRLPTKDELLTIVDTTRTNPCIDADAFPNTPSEWFWSASPYANSSNFAWIVDFGYGYSGDNSVDFTYRVRCVR